MSWTTRRCGCLVAFLSLLSAPAAAAPLELDRSQAVAEPRRDPGSGLCGSATRFAPPMPVDTPTSAATALPYLDAPRGDSRVVDRVSRIFPNLNFRVSQGGAGDFTTGGSDMFPDELLPFSSGSPMSEQGDDRHIALRLRGYLNVTAAMAGAPLTMAVHCDDGCQLYLGRSRLPVFLPEPSDDLAPRVARQVLFRDPGLYPVQLIYFQNGSSATLEWARALSAEPEGALSQPLDTRKFQLIPAAELYSAVVGTGPACIECGAVGMGCTSGSHCGDGLCHPCNLPDHCGAMCIACPANARLCEHGRCVECVSDDMCPSNQDCDLTTGRCYSPIPCTRNADCAAQGKICGLYCLTQACMPPPIPCTSDLMCPVGRICDKTLGTCRKAPPQCASHSECTPEAVCSTQPHHCSDLGVCALGSPPDDGGPGSPSDADGSGCAVGRNGGQSHGIALMTFLATLLASLALRRRRAVRMESAPQ